MTDGVPLFAIAVEARPPEWLRGKIEKMKFDSLGLAAPINAAVAAAGYTDPTPVQARAIPEALAGRDLMVSSQTGSGKTAAFMLPALQLLTEAHPVAGRGPRVLVLTPTRELSMQVTKAAETYGRNMKIGRASWRERGLQVV